MPPATRVLTKLRWLLLLAAACVALPCVAQNQLANSEFDDNLVGWEISGQPVPLWSSQDFLDDANSGSAQVENTDAAGFSRLLRLRQCVQVPPDKYLFSASGLRPAGEFSGRLVMSYVLRFSSACTGGFTANGGQFLANSANLWERKTTVIDVVSGAQASIEILLSVEKDPEGGSVVAYFDAVRLVRVPLFADGFESL